jgi:hypothetical protein
VSTKRNKGIESSNKNSNSKVGDEKVASPKISEIDGTSSSAKADGSGQSSAGGANNVKSATESETQTKSNTKTQNSTDKQTSTTDPAAILNGAPTK